MNSKEASSEQFGDGRKLHRELSQLLNEHKKEQSFDQVYKSVASLLFSYKKSHIPDRHYSSRVQHQLRIQENELKFIYEIFDLMNRLNVKQDEVLQKIVDLIPGVGLYPGKIYARIRIGDRHFSTKDFRDSSQKLTADIIIDNKIGGIIEIVFTGKDSSSEEDTFIPEEDHLINMLSNSIGQFLYRVKTRAEYEQGMIRLKKAQELARMGDFVWELSSGNVTWSDGMYELLEYDKQEQINIEKVNVDIHHPDDLDEVVNWLNTCVESGKREHGPKAYRLVTKTGKVLDVQTTLMVLHEGGNPVRIFGTVLDITTRNKNLAERKKTEEIKEAIIKSSKLAILSIDLSGHVMTWNDAAEKIFGWTLEEAKGKRLPIVQDDKIAEFEVLMNKVVSGGGFQGLELVRQKKNGDLIDVSLSTAPIKDEHGNVIGVMESLEDITERKLMEKRLKENEEKFRLIAHNSIDCLWQLDNKLRFTYLSPSLYKITGYYPAEWLGTRISQHTTWSEFVKMGRLLLKMLKSYKNADHATFETAMYNKAGKLIPLEIVGKPLFENGKLAGLQGSTRDIRERKAAEARIYESESKYRTMFENMAAASCYDEVIYQNGKPVDYRIIDVNPAYVRLSGLYREDIQGKLASEVYGTKKIPLLQQYAEVAKTGKPANFEIWFEPLKRYLNITVGSPKPGFFSTVFTDVTRRREIENELRKLKNDLETQVEEKTIQLQERITELERFRDATVEREFRMKELRDELEQLKMKQ